MLIFKAKYSGSCCHCLNPIAVGQPIKPATSYSQGQSARRYGPRFSRARQLYAHAECTIRDHYRFNENLSAADVSGVVVV